MRSRNWIWLVVAALVVTLSGCSDYARPDTSSVGLSYEGGDVEAKKFYKCVQPGDSVAEDWGGTTAYYPNPSAVITVDFSDRVGAEAPPIKVSTSNQQEMIQTGTINLRLKSDCTPMDDPPELGGKHWPGGVLQRFHEEIGQRNGAAFTDDSSVIPQGWISSLQKFVAAPAERAMDNVGPEYTWQNLYSNKTFQDEFAGKVKDELPNRMTSSTGGYMYFEIISVELDKPTVPEGLRGEMEAKEKQLQAQQTDEQKRAFIAAWPGGTAGYEAFQAQQRRDAETACLQQGRCPVVVPGAFPVPAGGS